jgi:hypothetical protein
MPRNRTSSSRSRLNRVSVRAERRSEPDWDRFAYALLQHVKLTSDAKSATARKRDQKR